MDSISKNILCGLTYAEVIDVAKLDVSQIDTFTVTILQSREKHAKGVTWAECTEINVGDFRWVNGDPLS